MDIFSVITFLGGLAFFLYGMSGMSKSLEKLAGSKLEVVLKKVTSNKLIGLGLGAGITAVIQSSSAMTVMLVGLVNSGIMSLHQSVGVLIGSHVGTTITSWIISLSGIESSNVFLRMLNPESFSPILALIGVILIMAAKHNRTKDIGHILVEFAILITGMMLMKDSVAPLAESESFSNILTAFNNPILSVLVGAAFTAVIQSSSASVGVLQSLALSTGAITYGMAIPLIMGMNIGTCITALISSIGVNRDARRVAIIHVCVQFIGTLVLLPLFLLLNWIFQFAFVDTAISVVGVATVHTTFNLITTILIFPFTKYLEKFACFLIKDKDNAQEKTTLLDERLLATPSVAIEVSRNVTIEMGNLAKRNLNISIQNLFSHDEELEKEIEANEMQLDKMQDKLNAYLVRICKHSIASKDSRTVSKMLHSIGNFERIGDHSINIMMSARELREKEIWFSPDAEKELQTICGALTDTLDLACRCFEENNLSVAHRVEPLQEVIETLNIELKNRHIQRLQNAQCTVELGYVYQDLLTTIERVSDHCSNIASVLIETDEQQNIHKYMYQLKENDSLFQETYHEYLNHYYLELGQPEMPQQVLASNSTEE